MNVQRPTAIAAASLLATALALMPAAVAGDTDAVKLAYGLVDAVNRQSSSVQCGVQAEAREIVCMVAEGITDESAERFAERLTAVAEKHGMPGGWTVIVMYEE
ncbi:MAG: hypothetical protein OXQ29_01005 [Rhodospirillaceae bacterium]|nr:hypothetical protein [Rhodospirillaceae bacterium]